MATHGRCETEGPGPLISLGPFPARPDKGHYRRVIGPAAPPPIGRPHTGIKPAPRDRPATMAAPDGAGGGTIPTSYRLTVTFMEFWPPGE
jgi:hypothetical protein